MLLLLLFPFASFALSLYGSVPLETLSLCHSALMELQPWTSHNDRLAMMHTQIEQFKLCNPQFNLWVWQSPHRKDLDQLDAFRLEAKISVVKAKHALIQKWKAKRNVIPIENDYPRMILWTILLNAICILVMIVCKSTGLMKKKPAKDDKAKESQDEDDHKVSHEDFQRLLLERRGLKVVEESKDGNCLSRCVARHLNSFKSSGMSVSSSCAPMKIFLENSKSRISPNISI